ELVTCVMDLVTWEDAPNWFMGSGISDSCVGIDTAVLTAVSATSIQLAWKAFPGRSPGSPLQRDAIQTASSSLRPKTTTPSKSVVTTPRTSKLSTRRAGTARCPVTTTLEIPSSVPQLPRDPATAAVTTTVTESATHEPDSASLERRAARSDRACRVLRTPYSALLLGWPSGLSSR
ncbi:MAG: hypothetical protein ACI9MR_003125, partial [Myxococcota bacterium]